MPLRWDRSRNPYVFRDFGKLRLGPKARPTQVVAQARNLARRIAAGDVVEIAGVPLGEHEINEASARLREPDSLAHELLLVHETDDGPGLGDGLAAVEAIGASLREISRQLAPGKPPALVHPLAIFLFLAEPRELAEVDECRPGADPRLDIVFDS